jgi:hypothetical protein
MAKSFLNMSGYPLGLRNNNPGNLRTGDNWQGMIGSNQGFVVFENLAWGIRALGIDLRSKINNGYNTISKIITRYAPPIENDTNAYIAAVVEFTGLSADHVLSADGATLRRLIRAIMNVELGTSYSALVTDADIDEGLAKVGGLDLGTVGFGISVVIFLFALYLMATMPKMPKFNVSHS